MKKQEERKILSAAIWMILFLTITIFCCIQYTSTRMTEFSFERLEEMTEDAAREYKEGIGTSYATLTSMAQVLSLSDISDTQALVQVLNTCDFEESYISMQLLTKDQMLLDQEGKWTKAAERIDFAEEAKKAPYLSGRCEDFLVPDKAVVHMAVPVIKNGETTAILYGVLALQEISENYTVNDFGGKAFVMLIDGNTGDVLLDTWHASLGNLKDYAERNVQMGDTFYMASEKMYHDENGDLAFVSKTRGMVLYLHYEPVGVNHWSAVIGIPEEVALERTHTIVKSLYIMAAIIFVVLVLFTAAIVFFLLRINREVYRMGTTDEGTGLLNRSAYEAYLRDNHKKLLPSAACIYIDANGLHELNNQQGHAAGDAMLRTVAEALQTQWTGCGIYRIGGDEFVVFPKETDEAVCQAQIERLCTSLEQLNYSISVGFARGENETGLERIILEADKNMLQNKAEYHAKHDVQRSPR